MGAAPRGRKKSVLQIARRPQHRCSRESGKANSVRFCDILCAPLLRVSPVPRESVMPERVFWDTKVAPRGRGGQGDGAGSLSRVFAAAHPCQTAHGRFVNRPCAGGGARGSVLRVGEGSTAVRIFQEGWRNCGIGADWWGEVAQSWGSVGRAWGWMGQGRERVAREGDAFSGYGGAIESCVGDGVRPGCTSDRPRDTGLALWQKQRELYTVLDRGEG